MKPELPQYKDFPKYDARRHLLALEAVVRLKDMATIYYIAPDIGCNRAEAQRALEACAAQYGVEFEKQGSVYKVVGWGVIRKTELAGFLKACR